MGSSGGLAPAKPGAYAAQRREEMKRDPLGNAAWRAGRTIRRDRPTYTCIGEAEATGYLERANYRKPWTLPTLAQL